MDSLPNELLFPILNHADIPLQERIHLRAVASRWQVVIEDGLKKETTLVIRDTHAPALKGPNDLLVKDVEYFDADLVALLHRLFPSVTQLTVNFSSNAFFAQLPEFLSKYMTTMTSFTLDGSYDFDEDDDQSFLNYELDENCCRRYPYDYTETIFRLAEAINALTSLTSLELFAGDISSRMPPFLVPTLGRLERFAFRNSEMKRECGDYKSLVPLMITSLGARCASLNLHSVSCDDGSKSWCFASEGGPSLTSTLHMNGRYSFPFYLHTAFLQSLSHLEQLTELRLTHLFLSDGALQLPSRDDHPLASVKQLHFSEMIIVAEDISFNGRTFCQHLAAWFPGLERLNIHCPKKHVFKIKANLDQFPKSVIIHVEGFQSSF